MNALRQASEFDIRAALKLGIARLREARISSFTLSAELLLLHAVGHDRTWLYAHPEEPVSPEGSALYRSLLSRRIAGEPTQYLIGRQEFWGLDFEVTPDVLIPRPETEHLVEVTLDRLAVLEVRAGRPRKNEGAGLRIADVGTGSGCIVVALAKELSRASFAATDISPAALAVARRNAERHSVVDRVSFEPFNLLDPFVPSQWGQSEGPLFDAIVSNPPYIGLREAPSLEREVRDHEPHVALFGGHEGYELYGALIAQSAKCLKVGGLLVLELGHNSLPAVRPLLDAPHWTNVGVTDDLAKISRVIAAERTA